ncbi:MAG: ankyrin repeat domain-containing protein, partial [Acidobacteriota bacterium]|nr:ankyrin repeat domain-containing protein [Acidobacteriota bacterium]
ETGLYAGEGKRVVDDRNRPFAPQYPLWSDGAGKRRWVRLPEGSSIDVTNADYWEFPVGTKFWKEFDFDGRKVETRFLWKVGKTNWVFASYAWNAEQTEAMRVPEAGLPDAALIAPGKRHGIPSVMECRACHDSSRTEILGFGALQLSDDRDPNALHADTLTADMITLRTLVNERLISPMRTQFKTNPPRITAATPEARAALGYLSTNCGSCHNRDSSIASLGLLLKYSVADVRRAGTLVPAARYRIGTPMKKLATVLALVGLVATLQAASNAPIADAAMAKDAAAVKKLLKEGVDVNAAQGDGMTALHWAALNGDAELASMLLYAGANVGAKTRLGGFTPLHLAAQIGHASVIAPLIAAGSAVGATTATGATALMQASHAGSTEAVRMLIENGAGLDVKETANGQTALMFAAAADRVDVVKLLLSRGADVAITSRVEDFAALTTVADVDQNGVPRPAPVQGPGPNIPGVTRGFNYNELIGKHGGLAALHFAARQGALSTVGALVEGGANINQRGAGDKTTPILVA